MQGAANASLESRVRKCGLLKERNLCLLAYSKRFVWSLGYLINQLLVLRKEGSTLSSADASDPTFLHELEIISSEYIKYIVEKCESQKTGFQQVQATGRCPFIIDSDL